jgi:XisH protein
MAKDIYHNLVREALEHDGWTITHDPYYMPIGLGRRKVAADFGAEKFITAQKGMQKILVEVKSFITASNINELHHAVGQYDFYALLLEELEPDRIPFLAMPKDAYEDLIREPIVQLFLNRHKVELIVFDIDHSIIYKWIKL